ncbi:MAG: redoxin domain-containing protein [Acidobacteriota bacterium]
MARQKRSVPILPLAIAAIASLALLGGLRAAVRPIPDEAATATGSAHTPAPCCAPTAEPEATDASAPICRPSEAAATEASAPICRPSEATDASATTSGVANAVEAASPICRPAGQAEAATSPQSATPLCLPPEEPEEAASAPATAAAPTCHPAPGNTAADSPVCKPASASTATPSAHPLIMTLSEPMRKIATYMSDHLMAGGSPAFSEDEIIAAAEISRETFEQLRASGELDLAVLKTAVFAELGNRGVDACALGGASNCAVLNACSINSNLAGASGELLARYQKEKEQDGATYTDWVATNFTLPTTAGTEESLSAHTGHPVVVTFLAGHCSHSLNTLPLLDDLRRKYADTDLTFLPVYINSGSVDDVRSWSDFMDLDLPLAVADNAALADEYRSFLVPSTLLIDSSGHVTKKLIGYKDENTLDAAIQGLLAPASATSRQAALPSMPQAAASR